MVEEITRNKIETYVIIDLETTNLPQYGKTRITELSIVTISKSDLQKNILKAARVQNKLTLLFNPQVAIHPEAGDLTGLNNYILESENIFDENAANTIINFIDHLKFPCLVAHNGNKFDFPILKKQLAKIKKELPNSLLCIDSLPAIRHLDSQISKSTEIVKAEPIKLLQSENIEEYTKLLSDEYDDLFKEIDIEILIKNNESTPKRPPTNRLESINRKKKERNDLLGNHEENSFKKEKNYARKSLFSVKDKPTDFKLISIYKRLFNEEPPVSHQAEADVLVLQKILQHYGHNFVDYAEIHAKDFNAI